MNLYDSARDMFLDWPVGTIVFTLVALLSLAMVGFGLWRLFIALDSCFLPEKSAVGKILSKEFSPAHTDTVLMYNSSLKMSLPQSISYDDDWNIEVQVGRRIGWISVSEYYYSESKVGDTVTATYTCGRFTDDLYLKEVN